MWKLSLVQQYRPILWSGVLSSIPTARRGRFPSVCVLYRVTLPQLPCFSYLVSITCMGIIRLWCCHGIKIGEGYVSAENMLLLLLLFSSRAPAGILFMTSTYAVFPLWLCAKNSLILFSVSFFIESLFFHSVQDKWCRGCFSHWVYLIYYLHISNIYDCFLSILFFFLFKFSRYYWLFFFFWLCLQI